VPVTTLPELLSARDLVPDFAGMDIEGAQILVIDQLAQMELQPSWFFEVHPSLTGEDEVSRCLGILQETGHALRQTDALHSLAVCLNTCSGQQCA